VSLPEGLVPAQLEDDNTIVESDRHLVRFPVQHHAPRALERVVECVLLAVRIRLPDLDCPVLGTRDYDRYVGWYTAKGR